MNNFDWNQFEPLEQDSTTQSDQGFDWNQFEKTETAPVQEIEKNEEPSRLREVGRHAVRTGSRVVETVLGFPGDIVQFTKTVGEKLPATKQKPTGLQDVGRSLLEKLPTSEDIKSVSSYLTGGFTDPQGAAEELGDELTSLSTALAIPFKNPEKFTSFLGTLGKSIAKSIPAVGARKTVEEFGGGQGAQSAAELGTLFLTGLIGKKTANKFVGEQFSQAKSKIPKGAMIPTQTLVSDLERVERDLSKGISTPTKKEVLGAVEELKNKASGGAMPVEDLVQSYHDINERLTGKKLFDDLSKSERKLLKTRYDQFKTQVNNAVADYGRYNPEFFDQWKKANQGFATIAQSRKISNFFEKNVKKLPPYLIPSVAVDLFMGHPTATGATALSFVGIKTGEMLNRIAKSPILRKHYTDVISAATEENFPAVVRSLKELDKVLNTQQDRH